MAIIKFRPMEYIRYFMLNSPMLIACFSILASVFNQDLKGVLFITGGVIIMWFGSFITTTLGQLVPQDSDRLACNLFTSGNWGTKYSSPGPNALFLSYAFAYLTSGMFWYSNYNFALLPVLILTLLGNAWLRVRSFRCVNPLDVFGGWFLGLVWGVGWYAIMAAIESSNDNKLSLTYFNASDYGDKCKVTNRKFRCKKVQKA